MEEKERYKLCVDVDEEERVLCHYIYDIEADTCYEENELDKLVKWLNVQDKKIKELQDYIENTANLIDNLTEDNVSARTDLAISELEKLKKYWDWYKNTEYKTGAVMDFFIDNQIKELKGEKPTIKCSLCGREMIKLADGVNYCCNHCHTQTLIYVNDIGEK